MCAQILTAEASRWEPWSFVAVAAGKTCGEGSGLLRQMRDSYPSVALSKMAVNLQICQVTCRGRCQ